MLVAHLIGGNEVKGFAVGEVYVNDEKLSLTYEQIVRICGNISLGDVDTSMDSSYIKREYTKLVEDYEDDLPDGVTPNSFVTDNFLTKEVCYSEYELDAETKSLKLKIDIFN